MAVKDVEFVGCMCFSAVLFVPSKGKFKSGTRKVVVNFHVLS